MARHPKPTKLKLIEGNPGKRALHPELEPQPFEGAPARPSIIKRMARKHWDYLIQQLAALKILATCDQATIMAAALRYGEVYDLQSDINRMRREIRKVERDDSLDMIKRIEKRNDIQRILLASDRAQSQAIKDLVSIESQLGLNPTARTRIRVDKPSKPKTRREELLS